MTKNDEPSAPGVDPELARSGGISYLHIPAADVREAALFYQAVFGWDVRNIDTPRPGFIDGTGHVAGAWMSSQAVSRDPGLLPYIYVEQIDSAVQLIITHGGEIVEAPAREGNLLIATFRDPAGNLMGIWQQDAG
jgi:predicted enzyme related to lactoylglutathione lyase